MLGVRYTSAARNPSGYGEAARNFITALFVAGVNVTCETISQMPEESKVGLNQTILEVLEGRDIPYKVKIIHLTPDLIPRYMEDGVYTISHLFWECDKLPKEWVKPLNEINEIWTASDKMANMIKNSGVATPCFTFPQSIMVERSEENIVPLETQYKKDFIFYTIAQWIPRKNFKGLLRAYWKEFEGDDNVTLLLKTYRVHYSKAESDMIEAEIEAWKKEVGQKHYPKIFLLDKLLSDKQISQLHAYGDVYVNASSGEGWCRPMQEAMIYGKPVISGDNGGITDIMSHYYYNQVPSTDVQATVTSFIPWYTSDQHWKELDEEALGKMMRKVMNDMVTAKKTAKKAQEFCVENFSYQRVGGLMYERIRQIYAEM